MTLTDHNPNGHWPLTTLVGVLCGGWSSERDVSLRSGQNCLSALHRLGFTQARLIDVQQARENLPAFMAAIQAIEVAFLTIHGSGGEDGAIQGFLEVLGIPYTGNGIKASALTMDKIVTKHLLAAHGLPVLPTLEVDTALDAMTWPIPDRFPVMVKPLGEGSSIGMQKVNALPALAPAIRQAAQYSQRVMIEPYIQGLSVTVGVLEPDGTPVATPILGFKTKTEWYDLTAKYTPGLTEFLLPAPLPAPLTQTIQALTVKAHQVCYCRGVSRIDWIVDEATQQPYILEVNTIPGMTDLSDLPAQAQAMHIGYDQLVNLILHTATKPVPVLAPTIVK
jgi:D-alanine-D-alanine ligase